MKILKAKIKWFPKKIINVTKDNLKIDWEQKHLDQVKKFMKKDGLMFPGVIKDDEIHCGHYRLKIAKEMGYDGIEMYNVDTFKEVLYLTQFSELCYKHYKELKELKIKHKIKNYL
tara:strand:- start:6738 stop:7082 length:345 start_codon:yes stop_codon:yes gene_type:complete